MAAFARLASVVRYFHPTDSVLLTNWDRFTGRGLLRVEDAASPEILASRLRELFADIAPAVQVFPTRQPAATWPAARAVAGSRAAIVYWEHRGVSVPRPFAASASRTYRSVLRIDAAPQWQRPPGAPDPDSAYVIQLEHGVTARVPMSFWTSLPTDRKRRERTPNFPWRAMFPTPADRAMRLAGVVDIWGVMQHFYLYHDVVPTDWPAALRTALRSASTDSLPTQYARTLKRLVAALHDGHGRVSYPDVANAAVVPVVFAMVEGQLTVVHVATRQGEGLKAGDVVVRFNGRSTADVLAERLTSISSATEQWAEYVTVTGLRRLAVADTVTLEVRSGAAARAPLRRVRLGGQIMGEGPSEPRPASMAEVRPGTRYIDLNTFTNDDFARQFAVMQQARAIIFDLRGYPRMNVAELLAHLTDSIVHSAHFEIPIFRRPDRVGVSFVDHAWTIRPIAPRLQARIVFLVDGRTISQAESVMGVIEHYRLAEIVGEPTAGTNGDVNPFVIPGGYEIVWTGLQVRKRDGSPHHGVGIRPTVLVHRTLAGARAGQDELLERAIEVAARPSK